MRGSNREEKLNAMLEAFNSQNEKANARDSEYQKRRAEFERLNSHNKSYNTSSDFKASGRNFYTRTDKYRQAHKRSEDAYNDLMTTLNIHRVKAAERAEEQDRAQTQAAASGKGAQVSLKKETYKKPAKQAPNINGDSYYTMINAMHNVERNADTDDEGYMKRRAEFERLNSRNATYTFSGNRRMVRRSPSLSSSADTGGGIAPMIFAVISLFFFGLLFLWGGLSSTLEQQRLKKECTYAVTAERVEIKNRYTHSRGKSTDYYEHIYSYTYEGEEYSAKFTVFPKKGAFAPTDQMEVFISPTKPSEYYFPTKKVDNSSDYILSVMFIGAGCAALMLVRKKRNIY